MDIDVIIEGAFATCDLDLVYSNPSSDCALEATYEFHLEKNTLLAKLTAELNGQTVEAQVRDKVKAQERYDDAVAAGDTALLAQRDSEKKEIMSIRLGNLLPEQTLRLRLKLIYQLEILQGSYHFELPMGLYPDYSRHVPKEAGQALTYEFSYQVSIACQSKISNLSVPEGAEVTNTSEDGSLVQVRSGQRGRKLNFYWRTRDMMKPHLLYAKNAKTSEVACVASLVPTFEPPAPQEDMEVLLDEEPEMTQLAPGSDFHFVFVVDRSGSMSGAGRMDAAKQALELFMRSLPTDCMFSICSFGTRFTWMTCSSGGQSRDIPYNESTQDEALAQIAGFRADHGGTDIRTPLEQAQAMNSGRKKRVFILTDG